MRAIGGFKGGATLLATAVMGLAAAGSASAADPVRGFDGSDDQMRVRATGALNLTGAVTMAALIRPDTLGDDDLISLHTSAGSGNGYEFFHDSNGLLGMWNGSKGAYSSPNPLVADEWQLAVVTKASGTVTPRFHVYRFSTGKWTHGNSSGTLGNASSIAGGTVRFGAWENSWHYDGDFAAAALFGSALSDANVETMSDSYDDWTTLAPAGMWIFNQTDLTHPLLDETWGGADEAFTSGTTVVANAPPMVGEPDTTIFRGDLSTGDTSQWWDVQEVGTNASVTVETSNPSPPPGETHYGRFELRGGDSRAELYAGVRLYSGEDVYVRFLARLDSPFPAETGVWGQLIWQLHQQNSIDSPPVALYITGTNPGRFALLDTNDDPWWLGPDIDEGEWHEFVIRVRHSTNDQVGFVELWLDGLKQTMGSNQDRIYGATMLDSYNYLKSGYYRDDDMLGTGVVRIAGYRVARSMDDLP